MAPKNSEMDSDEESFLDDAEAKLIFGGNPREISSEEEDLEKGWINTDGIYKRHDPKYGYSDDTLWGLSPELRRRALFATGSRRAYLVRVPKYLAEAWTKTPHLPGEILGEIAESSRNLQSGGPVKITLPQNNSGVYENLPESYILEKKKDNGSIPRNKVRDFVLETDVSGAALGISGSLTGDMLLQTDLSDPSNLVKSQLAIGQPISEKQRNLPTVRIIDDAEEQALNVYQSQSIAQSAKRKLETRRKVEVIRRERLPRSKLLELLFKCFSDYEYWSFRSLQDHTQQPQQYLKDILGEVAQMVRRGPYIGKYTLKSEFKDNATNEGIISLATATEEKK